MSERSRERVGRRSRPVLRRLALLAVFAILPIGNASAGVSDGTIGPGVAHTVIQKAGYRIAVSVTPNLGGRIDSRFRLTLTRDGKPVPASVNARFTMIGMEMPSLSLHLKPVQPNGYEGTGTRLTMPGRWQILFHVKPRGGSAFELLLIDVATVE